MVDTFGMPEASQLRSLHLKLTIMWALLIIPTVIWWKTSILWVALLSCYANAASHWGAYEGARAEEAMVSSIEDS